jgi:glycosyltransferase involved in cell wall biosynthesis
MILSASIIVKNEESCLVTCLESIKDHVQEIIIVDTGSTDTTKEIARKYTDKIYDFPWCDDFAKARNYALKHCSGDYVLSIDADEQLITPPTVFKGKAMNVTLSSNGHTHNYPRLLKRGTKWVGAIHEVPDAPAEGHSGAVIEYGYSEAHKQDPDRNLRILQQAERTPRTLYYLGNEYFDRKQYAEAITAYTDYLTIGHWQPEVADAHLRLARCYWYTQQGVKAREHCLQAIGLNPDFTEALYLMAEMTFEPMSSKWKKIAERSTGKDVLFNRVIM